MSDDEINNNNGLKENITDDKIKNNDQTNKYITDNGTNNELTNMNMIDDELNNKYTKKNDNKIKAEEDPATYFLSFYAAFFAMGVYRICQMKDNKGEENRTNDVSNNEEIQITTNDVWKLLFFANNGALLATIIDIVFFNSTLSTYFSLVLSAIGFLAGSVYFLYQYIKKCNQEYASYYFSCEKIVKWFKLPCYIIPLIGLADSCCIIKSDTPNNECSCECFWIWVFNIFVYLTKIFAIIYAVVSYYIFVIFLLIFWAIGFLIYNSMFNKKDNKNKSSNFSMQTSGNNDTQINSTSSDGINSTIKNPLGNNEAIIVIQNYKINNEEINNQNTNDPYRKEIGGDNNIESSPNFNNMLNFTSQRSFENIKEYFNQPEEKKDNKIYMKSINVFQMNFNANIEQNENKPEVSSIHKSNAEFY
jgi:hypothetical protein